MNRPVITSLGGKFPFLPVLGNGERFGIESLSLVMLKVTSPIDRDNIDVGTATDIDVEQQNRRESLHTQLTF